MQRMALSVLCLRRKAVMGAVCIAVGMLLIVGAVRAQSLVNFPQRQATDKRPLAASPPAPVRAPVVEYRPSRPPLASNPGVLEAPELTARALNESDASYTARMMQMSKQLKADDMAAQQDLGRVLRQVTQAGNGLGDAAVTAQPRPRSEIRSTIPPEQRMPAIYDDGRGRRVDVREMR